MDENEQAQFIASFERLDSWLERFDLDVGKHGDTSPSSLPESPKRVPKSTGCGRILANKCGHSMAEFTSKRMYLRGFL